MQVVRGVGRLWEALLEVSLKAPQTLLKTLVYTAGPGPTPVDLWTQPDSRPKYVIIQFIVFIIICNWVSRSSLTLLSLCVRAFVKFDFKSSKISFQGDNSLLA